MIFKRFQYLFLAASAKALHDSNLIKKNHPIFKKKRSLLIEIVPDSKLLSETAAVAHVLYHPSKKPEEIDSIKEHLTLLIKECDKRKISNLDSVVWAKRLLTSGYSDKEKKNVKKWKPSLSTFNSFHDLCKKRTTIRYVEETNIKRNLIDKLIAVAIEVPSSCNEQGWRFIIVNNKKYIEEISKIKKQPFIKHFPYVLCCCFDKNVHGNRY